MRRVRLQRNAFMNDTYCATGSVITLADGVAMAPFMMLLPDDPVPVQAPAPVPAVPLQTAPNKTVSVHYSEATGDVDIDVDGVEMHVDHAALKVKVD